MDGKRFVIGTLVGGITMFVLGYLIFELTFGAFYSANMGSATGARRDVDLVWALALGNLSLAALITLAVAGWPGVITIGKGFKIGAIVGFLVWLGVDFIHYGILNISNLTLTIVDPLLEIVHAGITGAVIGAVLGRLAESKRREPART
jgi:TctA family transporter